MALSAPDLADRQGDRGGLLRGDCVEKLARSAAGGNICITEACSAVVYCVTGQQRESIFRRLSFS